MLVFQSSQFASTHFIVNRHVFPYKKQHINSECLLSEKLRCLIGEILPIQRRITIVIYNKLINKHIKNNLLHVHVFDLHVACTTCPVNILTEKTSQCMYCVIFEALKTEKSTCLVLSIQCI